MESYRRKGEYAPPSEREVAAVADLSGDGRMEVLVFSHYYEGEAATV